MSMQLNERFGARVNPVLKQKALAVLNKIGIKESEAIRMFCNQIVLQQGIPFDLKIPNKETVEAMKEARRLKGHSDFF